MEPGTGTPFVRFACLAALLRARSASASASASSRRRTVLRLTPACSASALRRPPARSRRRILFSCASLSFFLAGMSKECTSRDISGTFRGNLSPGEGRAKTGFNSCVAPSSSVTRSPRVRSHNCCLCWQWLPDGRPRGTPPSGTTFACSCALRYQWAPSEATRCGHCLLSKPALTRTYVRKRD